MTIEEAEQYFGTLTNACRQLGIRAPNLTAWKRQGYIPLLQQYRIAELTDGLLMPDEIDPKLEYIKRKKDANASRQG